MMNKIKCHLTDKEITKQYDVLVDKLNKKLKDREDYIEELLTKIDKLNEQVKELSGGVNDFRHQAKLATAIDERFQKIKNENAKLKKTNERLLKNIGELAARLNSK